ncbi:MAG: hypothetical protein LBC75_11065 [Fibromonadaceae bacterium]|jgi:hypothetical protein|nr:hypothetical protein [Fibromonadaceae bacterium]
MNKTKILAFIALGAILSACGSDEGTPPELVNSYPNTISPFDTISVKFKSELVDLDKLDSTNIVFNHGKLIKPKAATGKELRFIGAKTTPGGLNYFEGGISDSIEFKKIKNSDGYIKERTVFYFSTLPILDEEPNDSKTSTSVKEIDAEKAATEKNGVTFAGVLDHRIGVTDAGQTIYDVEDYYMIKLKGKDTLSITVTNRDALNIVIKGPEGIKDLTYQAPKKSNVLPLYVVGLDYLLTNPTSDPVPFYINVTDNATTSPPNPYTIRIKVMKYKE